MNLRPPGYEQGEPRLMPPDPSPPVTIHRARHAVDVASVPICAAPSRGVLVTDLVTAFGCVLRGPVKNIPKELTAVVMRWHNTYRQMAKTDDRRVSSSIRRT